MSDERDDTAGGDAGGHDSGHDNSHDNSHDSGHDSTGATGDRQTAPGDDPVRRERWSCDGPAELEISVGGGRVRVDLVEGSPEVHVEVRADRSGAPWSGGLGGLLDWIGTSMGGGPPAGAGWSGRGFDPIIGAPWERSGDPSVEAVAATTIEWSEPGRRLVVRSPEEPALGAVPLIVTVSAPAGSRPAVRTGAAAVDLTGRASWAAVRTGSARRGSPR